MSKKKLTTNGIQITGYGHYFPERVVTDEEIQQRLKFPTMRPAELAVIGENRVVTKRFRANETETSQYMGAKAAEMAMKDAGVKPQEIDLFILANWTERYYLPDIAPQASKIAGTTNALAFDLSTACTGFVHGVQTACMYLLSGKFKKAIVSGSDKFSLRTKECGFGEYTSGDAAGAVVLEYTGNKNSGIIDTYLKDEESLKEIITCPYPNGLTKSYPELIPNAISHTLKAFDLLTERNQITPEDIDWMVPHPGTGPVVVGVGQNAKVPKEKLLSNFEYCGNTSAASIPIVLSENKHKGTFKKGDLVICPAVGGGWYWGGILFHV